MSKPLDGVRIVEMAGIGPGRHACLVLADLGAEVVHVERPGYAGGTTEHNTLRGRTILEVDVKAQEGADEVRELVARTDVLVEGYRPGVMERPGLGPDKMMANNSRLLYARMTGWG